MDRFLYFRTEATDANDDATGDSAIFPASSLIAMEPTTDSELTMYFSVDDVASSVILNLTAANTHLVASRAITHSISTGKVYNSNKALPHLIIIANDDSGGTEYLEGSGIASCGAIRTAAVGAVTSYRFPDMGSGNVAPTVLGAAGELAVNTHHTCAITAARAYTIPRASTSNKGDWITVLYLANIANATIHTYTVNAADAQLALGSNLRVTGEDDDRIAVIDTSVANDDGVKITGRTNGDGGIGTYLRFVNTTGNVNGWAVDCVVEGQGARTIPSADTLLTS